MKEGSRLLCKGRAVFLSDREEKKKKRENLLLPNGKGAMTSFTSGSRKGGGRIAVLSISLRKREKEGSHPVVRERLTDIKKNLNMCSKSLKRRKRAPAILSLPCMEKKKKKGAAALPHCHLENHERRNKKGGLPTLTNRPKEEKS